MKKKPLTDHLGQVRELHFEDIEAMRPAQEVLPPELVERLPKRKRGQRGVQKCPTKIALNVRYSPEVIEYFKSTGIGWQKRMDNALKEWMVEHHHAVSQHKL